jgi:hypothetical protein
MVMSLRTGGLCVAVAALIAGAFAGCGGTGGSGSGNSSGSGAGGSSSSNGVGGELFGTGTGPGCVGLECQQVTCSGGGTTSVSGTVYDPAGKTQLYNVVVYVPNAPLSPIVDGASCDKCGSTLSGAPVVTTLTDTNGNFKLENVPVGADIPLVIQVGKWRRQITLPAVSECVDNPINDKELTRLPKNKSEGSIPKIALTTGGADPLECLLRKIGIEDSEFTTESGDGRVNLYAGSGGSSKYIADLNGGAAFSSATKLWGDVASLMQYDIVLMACEEGKHLETKPAEARQAMHDYASQGGRIFASHWHNAWLENGVGEFPNTADFVDEADLDDPFTAIIDTSFPKGKALSEWLVNVGASSEAGELVIHAGQHTVDAVNDAISQQWIFGQNPTSVQYFTFNTPIGVPAENQCGRVVFSDIHVSSGDKDGVDFPSGCTTQDLSPQEKALLFMLFDLSACVQDDQDEPVPPPL